MLAAQPESGSGLPFLDDLIRGGPYAIIAVLMLVIRYIYVELREERAARLADRDKCELEKQALNDKVVSTSEKTTKAVIENTQVQRQLVASIHQIQDDDEEEEVE